MLQDLNEPVAARRYKFIHRNLQLGRMATCFSQDGLQWTQPQPWTAHDAAGDTHNNAIWSPQLGRYVCVTRGWSEGDYRGLRTVLRSDSADFLHWSRPVEILRGADAHDQIYSMPIARYRDVYIGLPAIFHKGQPDAHDWDTVDTELAVSADTQGWQRICPGQPLIPRGTGAYPDGEPDCGCVYAAAPFVHKGEIYIHYGGSNGLHNNWREGSLNLATLPLDRFAGYAARGAKTGYLRTTPLHLRQRDLQINAEVEAGGSIRAAVIDSAGSAQTGLSLDDCIPVSLGGGKITLRWRNQGLDTLESKPFRLLLELRAASVYSLMGCARATDPG